MQQIAQPTHINFSEVDLAALQKYVAFKTPNIAAVVIDILDKCIEIEAPPQFANDDLPLDKSTVVLLWPRHLAYLQYDRQQGTAYGGWALGTVRAWLADDLV
ncbi:hypothetical protein [Zavarzinia sp. CC-PAN008]|uniref:hypothetical protein n=1 Tax=Zavarzinia sp. CC-PAN008 TaxID=3243332 RepID=UPI003F743981